MKEFFKKLTGLDKEEARIAEEKARVEEESMQVLKKKDPKAYATKRKEPWVSVLDVKVNRDNVRNGFFEMDWNEYFIKDLKKAGYGEDGDIDEEIVDRWFRDIVYNMLQEEGIDPADRSAGYINVTSIDKGKAEVS
jgi:hypothetical protein